MRCVLTGNLSHLLIVEWRMHKVPYYPSTWQLRFPAKKSLIQDSFVGGAKNSVIARRRRLINRCHGLVSQIHQPKSR